MKELRLSFISGKKFISDYNDYISIVSLIINGKKTKHYVQCMGDTELNLVRYYLGQILLKHRFNDIYKGISSLKDICTSEGYELIIE